MSKIFDSQIKHYKEKFDSIRKELNANAIIAGAKSNGVTDEFLKAGLIENSEEFRLYCYKYAKTLMPGRVSCTTYAAVVSVLADHYGVEYNVCSGFCLPVSNEKYSSEKAAWEKRRSETSEEHPVFANHVFLKINDKYYEYFNGDTSNIDHIDCITI